MDAVGKEKWFAYTGIKPCFLDCAADILVTMVENL
jgi:hypothetical protein